MNFGVRIRQLGQLVQTFQQSLYQPPQTTIAGNNTSHWPSAAQPVTPLGPPGSEPLVTPYWYGQNQTYTPRPDAEYDFAQLRDLARYPLARICIENAKDQLCQLPWRIELRPLPGETPTETKQRRKSEQKGDPFIRRMSQFLERPDMEHDWPTWLKMVLEDMLSIDAAAVQFRKTFNGKLHSLRRIPGDTIARYIDDTGATPLPPSPAYAQLWEGSPRVALTTDQLLYLPRNICSGNTVSSHLYGFSPTEQVAPEIEIGWARLLWVKRFYDAGSLPEFLHVVPSKATEPQIEKAMQWVNSELAGQMDRRRQYRIIQGFSEDGKGDQIIFPKEPVLADVFDDLHIRKICYAYGASPQRLQRMMNRGSAQASQMAAEDEGIRPWKHWIENSLMSSILWRCSGSSRYAMSMEMEHESDELKRTKIDDMRVRGGMATINDINRENGDEISTDAAADQLAITTPLGRIPIGMLPPAAALTPKGGDPEPIKPVRKYVNGVQ